MGEYEICIDGPGLGWALMMLGYKYDHGIYRRRVRLSAHLCEAAYRLDIQHAELIAGFQQEALEKYRV